MQKCFPDSSNDVAGAQVQSENSLWSGCMDVGILQMHNGRRLATGSNFSCYLTQCGSMDFFLGWNHLIDTPLEV